MLGCPRILQGVCACVAYLQPKMIDTVQTEAEARHSHCQEPWVSKFFGRLSTMLNPFCWVQSIIYWIFGNTSPPDYISDIIPLGAFYSENESRSTLLVTIGAIALCLLVVFAAETKTRGRSRIVPRRTLALCRITPKDVVDDRVHSAIEETFDQPRLVAACFVFDLVHEVTPVEAIIIMAMIHSLARTKGVPVYSFVENHAFSVGYLLSLVGSKIYATEVSLVGKLQFCKVPQPVSRSSRGEGYFEEISLGGEAFDKATDKLFQSKISQTRGAQLGSRMSSADFSSQTWIGSKAKDAGLVDEIKTFHSFARENFPKAAIKCVGGK